MDEKTSKALMDDYQKGISPLGLALKYNIEVAQVYEILNQPEMNNVTFVGDMVDDAGPGASIVGPSQQRVPYTKN